MKIRCLALCAAAFSNSATAADDKVYLEFLWDARPPHSIARQQTIQFLTDGQHTHQVCVATNLAETDVGGLVVKAFDASGQEVSSHQYPDYRGVKHCYDADLGQGGKPGLWTFRASTGDGRTGKRRCRSMPGWQTHPCRMIREHRMSSAARTMTQRSHRPSGMAALSGKCRSIRKAR